MRASILSKGQPMIQTSDGIALAAAQQLLREKDLLLEEMQHRVANSLQIIASILLIRARTIQSEETRLHLLDAHQRILSVAAVQKHLKLINPNQPIEIADYLSKLCATLGKSMIADSRSTAIELDADFNVVSSRDAVSLGLSVTELVMNALKHAFPTDRADAAIGVAYAVTKSGWKLAVSDNGAGNANIHAGKQGLGTSLIQALGKQLDARVDTISDCSGTTVSLTHGNLTAAFPTADVKSDCGSTRCGPQ